MRMFAALIAFVPSLLMAAAATRPATQPSVRLSDGTVLQIIQMHYGPALEIPEDEAEREKLKHHLPQWVGTEITLQLQRPQKDLAALDERNCKLLTARDDKGTDLINPKVPGLPAQWPSSGGFDFEHDSGSTSFEFRFAPQVAEGAKRIILDGKIAFLRGVGRHVVRVDDIPFSDDSKPIVFRLGDRKLTAQGRQFPNQIEVEIRTDWNNGHKSTPPGELALIRELELVDGNGKTIPASIGGGGSTIRDHERFVSQISWRIDHKPAKVSAIINSYEKLEPVEMPFHFEYVLPPIPQGPFASSIKSEKFNCIVEVEYDKYLLINSGISPRDIDAQLKKSIEALDELKFSELFSIMIKIPQGEAPLQILADTLELRVQKSSPQTRPTGK